MAAKRVVLKVGWPRDRFDPGNDLPVVTRDGTEVNRTQADEILKAAGRIRGLQVFEVKDDDEESADEPQQVSGPVDVQTATDDANTGADQK